MFEPRPGDVSRARRKNGRLCYFLERNKVGREGDEMAERQADTHHAEDRTTLSIQTVGRMIQ